MQAIFNLIRSRVGEDVILTGDGARILGQNKLAFAELFRRFDRDGDNMLNAAELRGMFSELFGNPVSTEHLLHFENRYLVQYGEHGCLSKDKFFAILEDYEKAHQNYSLSDDIFELYHYLVGDDDSTKVSVNALCLAICALLPNEYSSKMQHFRDILTRTARTPADISFETFRTAVCDIFEPGNAGQAPSRAQSNASSSDEQSTVRHPMYCKMLANRVARYENGLTDLESFKPMLDVVTQELQELSTTSTDAS